MLVDQQYELSFSTDWPEFRVGSKYSIGLCHQLLCIAEKSRTSYNTSSLTRTVYERRISVQHMERHWLITEIQQMSFSSITSLWDGCLHIGWVLILTEGQRWIWWSSEHSGVAKIWVPHSNQGRTAVRFSGRVCATDCVHSFLLVNIFLERILIGKWGRIYLSTPHSVLEQKMEPQLLPVARCNHAWWMKRSCDEPVYAKKKKQLIWPMCTDTTLEGKSVYTCSEWPDRKVGWKASHHREGNSQCWTRL